ncbi:mitochondrial amidoxime-reducing component 1-like [Teleopsis dalmanni]|uniref:mitochondrial amidoxime-reducing component 1-like n=1 Tax=Teleopsis dalmanni TaxID=139649 RepID=UPI0018CF7F1A|nr:mitochondrial amidoxime-reducing component 1-like [Teleopsis dalmanni]
MSSTSTATTKLAYIVGAAVGVTVVAGLIHWYRNSKKKEEIPKKWRRVGTLKQLNMFPIKSCAPLILTPDTVISCDILGLRLATLRDRQFMIIDTKNQIVTARTYPRCVLIKITIISAFKLMISAPGMENIELYYFLLAQDSTKPDVNTNVFGSKVKGVSCGEIYDKWLSKYLLGKDSGLRLIYYPYSEPTKPIDKGMRKEPHITSSDTGAYNDATSYMLMNLSSIKDLNTRMEHPVDPLQFRGGFYIEMDKHEPYAEDEWNWIKIGDNAVFRAVAPCGRCILPNINVKTGERSPINEPLKTLNSYRRKKNYGSPLLGVHLGLRQAGDVKMHDVMYVEDNSVDE